MRHSCIVVAGCIASSGQVNVVFSWALLCALGPLFEKKMLLHDVIRPLVYPENGGRKDKRQGNNCQNMPLKKMCLSFTFGMLAAAL
jgi:hypothetical protein